MVPARIRQFINIIFVFLLLWSFSASASYAQSIRDQNISPEVPNTSNYRTQINLYNFTSAVMCQLTGIDIVNPTQPCLGIDPVTNKIGFIKQDTSMPIGGAVGSMVGMITMTYDIPIHIGDYTNYLSSGFGIIKPAHAQTTGFNNLTALMSLWKKARDLTYLGFVLVFVLIGLGVMLRIKLDPRTVMTVQNQIPKVIIYLILITFSYAIVGLAIDMMWVTTYTGINLITSDTLCEDGTPLSSKSTSFLYDNPIHYVNNTLGCPWGANKTTTLELGWNVGRSIGEIVSRMLLSVIGIDPGSLDGKCSVVFDGLVTCAKRAINTFIANILGAIVALVVVIAVLVQLARVWLGLVKAYLYILLYTILAPIWILAGLVPNNTNFGFTQWLRRIIFSLSLYPLTIFLFLLAVVIVSDKNINSPNISGGESFVPPLVANPTMANNMGYILALGVILITPEAINMAREMFKVSPSKYAPAAFAALGVGMGSAMAPPKKIWSGLNARRQDGSASGPLAFATDKFKAKAFKGIAERSDFLTDTYNRKFGPSALGGGVNKVDLISRKRRNAQATPTTGGGAAATPTTGGGATPSREPEVSPISTGIETEGRPDAPDLANNSPAAEPPPADEENT